LEVGYTSNFTKEVILITRASSGVGKACSKCLFQRCYKVFGTSRPPRPQIVGVLGSETTRSGSLEMIQAEQY